MPLGLEPGALAGSHVGKTPGCRVAAGTCVLTAPCYHYKL